MTTNSDDTSRRMKSPRQYFSRKFSSRIEWNDVSFRHFFAVLHVSHRKVLYLKLPLLDESFLWKRMLWVC